MQAMQQTNFKKNVLRKKEKVGTRIRRGLKPIGELKNYGAGMFEC